MTSPLIMALERVHEGFPHRRKDVEKARLFLEICRGRSPTRKGLAAGLTLRPTSVSQAVQELLADGLAVEKRRQARGGSGRPLQVLAPRPDRLLGISIYVDSRELKGVLVNMDETVLAEVARVVPADSGNRALKGAILGLARFLRERVPATSRLVGAGISLVGTVNARTRTWVNAARWPRLATLDFSGVETELGFPVLLQKTNETELAYWLACHPDAAEGSVLLLHWGFGIGSAVCHRGVTLASTIGRFGEIGHVRLASDPNAACICGSKGCLETDAALWALLPRLRGRLGPLPEDERKLVSALRDPRLPRLPGVSKALASVQAALLALQRIFYPDIILLSGPLVENQEIARRLTEGVRDSLPAYARNTVSFAVIAGGMEGCRRGGAAPLFRDTLQQVLRRKR